MTAEEYVAAQERRTERRRRVGRLVRRAPRRRVVEPTVPIVARAARRTATTSRSRDVAEISLTHYWDWTGFPVVALPSGVGRRSGLPIGVSLIGPPGADWDLLAAGAALQRELGTVVR